MCRSVDMYRSSKKTIFVFLLMLLLTSDSVAAYAEPMNGPAAETGLSGIPDEGQSLLLCPEGYYLELPEGYDGQIDIYDAHGKRMRGFQAYKEPGPPLQIYKGKLRCINSEKGQYLNFETGSIVGSFPREKYYVTTAGDYLIVKDIETLDLAVYDAEANQLAVFPDAGNSNFWIIENDLYTLLQNGSDIDVHRYDPDSGEISDVHGACFADADVLEFRKIFFLGDNYLINGDGWNRVVTKDWEEIYSGRGDIFMQWDSFCDNRYSDIQACTAEYFQEKTTADGTDVVNVLDWNLETVLSMTADEWTADRCEYTDGYLTGIPCPELDGRICAGFMGTGWRHFPYAREGEICYFNTDGQVRSIRIQEDQHPTDINSKFMVAWDRSRAYLYDIHTGAPVELPDSAENMHFQLGENSIMLAASYRDENSETSDLSYFNVLYDNKLREIARTQGFGTMNQWIPGMWYFKNELSDGIIDESGKWLLRRWNVRD